MKSPAESKSQGKLEELENHLNFDCVSLPHADLLAENGSSTSSRFERNICPIIG